MSIHNNRAIAIDNLLYKCTIQQKMFYKKVSYLLLKNIISKKLFIAVKKYFNYIMYILDRVVYAVQFHRFDTILNLMGYQLYLHMLRNGRVFKVVSK